MELVLLLCVLMDLLNLIDYCQYMMFVLLVIYFNGVHLKSNSRIDIWSNGTN